MNREVGTNPNNVWPRRLAAGIVFAIGAAGCSATGPHEIAGSESPITPVECVGEALNSYEVEPSAEEIRQNIDNLLCETANEAAASALAAYRENDILITYRDEGPDDTDSETYGFSYLRVGGTYVSTKFGTTAEGKPDLSNLLRIFLSKDEFDDEGEVIGTDITTLSRRDDGSWSISGFTQIGNETTEENYYMPSGQSSIQFISQQDYDTAFGLSIKFTSV